MTAQQFSAAGQAGQRRYFARSVLGFSRMRGAVPNAAHIAASALVAGGAASRIVTQNVDGLHVRAFDGLEPSSPDTAVSRTDDASEDNKGAAPKDASPLLGHPLVTELHGSIHRVRCLGCGAVSARSELQRRLLQANAHFVEETRLAMAADAGDKATMAQRDRPDGDFAIADELVERFVLVACEGCGGMLKPDVVFFGDTVARPVVESVMAAVASASVLLCLGTSLQVYSSFRFVEAAGKSGVPVAIVTQGETRGDPLAQLKLQATVEEVLPLLADELLQR